MNTNAIQEKAAMSFVTRLKDNPYPGRGIVLGRLETGEIVQLYWIMGRSAGSRNRIFEEGEGGKVYTEIADRSQLKVGEDTSLILYRAMLERHGYYAVSNGDQTDNIVDRMGPGATLQVILADRLYEPDHPNHTPRISAVYGRKEKDPFQILMIRKSPFNMSCDRALWTYQDIAPGFGRCITTYMGDGNPLPSFEGEPYLVPLHGQPIDVHDRFISALHEENFVSFVMKIIPANGPSVIKIHNKYQKV